MPGRLEPFARRTSSTPLATAATTLIPPRTRGVSNTSGSFANWVAKYKRLWRKCDTFWIGAPHFQHRVEEGARGLA